MVFDADRTGCATNGSNRGHSLTESPVLAIVVTLAVTWLLLPVATAVAMRTGTIARPQADRLSQRSVPMLGGVAIIGGLLAGTVVGLRDSSDLIPIVALVGGMAILGLIDDVGTVGPITRLALQSLAAMVFVAAVSGDLDTTTRIFAIAIAAIAVPLAMNATNLVDNADGLASSLSAVTALTLAGIGIVAAVGDAQVLFALLIAAACVVFLAFRNWPPATMFMGDVGSLGLGFALAAATILLIRDAITGPSSGFIALVLFPLAWGVQLSDLALVFVTRLRRGASPLRGGVDHTSHRLMLLGASPTTMLVGTASVAALLGVVAILVGQTQNAPLAIASVVTAAVGLALFEVWLVAHTEHHFRPGELAPSPAGKGAVPRSTKAILAGSRDKDA